MRRAVATRNQALGRGGGAAEPGLSGLDNTAHRVYEGFEEGSSGAVQTSSDFARIETSGGTLDGRLDR